MKQNYKVKYAHGLMGETIVSASDAAEAVKEAFATCRFHVACIPEAYGPRDVVASVELLPEGAPSGGPCHRPAVQVGKDEFVPPKAADVLKAMTAPDFSAAAAV